MKKMLSKSFYSVLHHLYRLLPINKHLVVFESQGDFSDNSWALYDYMCKLRKYRFVWIFEDKSRFENTTDTTFLWCGNFSERIRIIKSIETAAFCFNSHGSCCNYRRRKNQRIVTLWHGAPIKAGKGASHSYFDYCVVPGKPIISTMAKFLSADETKMLPLGYPRNDLLTHNIGTGKDNPFFPVGTGADKLILWMPTFRASNLSELSENNLDNDTGLPLLNNENIVSTFNLFLAENRVVVLAKIHRLQLNKPIFKKRFSNIIFLTDDEIGNRNLQLYQIIGKSDALLTDYSSVLVDYWIADKPQGFIVDDMDGYKQSRGFLYDDVESVLPGHHIKNLEELKSFVLAIRDGRDEFASWRRKLRDEMLVAVDGTACENICKKFNLR